MLRLILISMFDFRYLYIYIYIYILYIYILYYMYVVIIKHSFRAMFAHATITTIYIIAIEVSCMHLLLCAIYQNQKGL